MISCDGNRASIQRAITEALSTSFREKCRNSVNPYGEGGSSSKILNIILSENLNDLVFKSFFDIK